MDSLAILGTVANLIVAVIAIVALYLAWRQIVISRELSALEAYENYHMMCLQYPEFSAGDADFESFSANKLRCYEMFVLYTLMMDERIYGLFPKDVGWIFSIKDDIRMHRRFIASTHFSQHLDNQGWSFLPMIKDVLAEGAEVDGASRA